MQAICRLLYKPSVCPHLGDCSSGLPISEGDIVELGEVQRKMRMYRKTYIQGITKSSGILQPGSETSDGTVK